MKQTTTYNNLPKYKDTGQPALLDPDQMEFVEREPVVSFNEDPAQRIVLVGHSEIGMKFQYYITEEHQLRGLEEQIRQIGRKRTIEAAERLIMASAVEIGQNRPEFRSYRTKVYVLAGDFDSVMIVSPETYTLMLKNEM